MISVKGNNTLKGLKGPSLGSLRGKTFTNHWHVDMTCWWTGRTHPWWWHPTGGLVEMEGYDIWLAGAWSDFGSQEVYLTVSMWSFHQIWNYIRDVGGFVIVRWHGENPWVSLRPSLCCMTSLNHLHLLKISNSCKHQHIFSLLPKPKIIMKQLTGAADFLPRKPCLRLLWVCCSLRKGVNLGGWLLLEPGPSAPLSYWSYGGLREASRV